MSTQIFRSIGFADGTKWNSELLFVEVVTDGSRFDVLVYDMGFEPPYYDVSKPFSFDPFQRAKMTGGLKEAHEFLKVQHIVARAWREVPLILPHQSNSIIREDIRTDIRESIYCDKQIPPPIPASIGRDAIMKMSEYGGHSAEVSIYFVRSETPLSLTGTFYLMFRKPPQYAWGVVAKGSNDNISLLVECNGSLKCQLYDQVRKSTFQSGTVIHAKVDFITTPVGFEVNHTGCNSFPVPQPEVFTF